MSKKRQRETYESFAAAGQAPKATAEPKRARQPAPMVSRSPMLKHYAAVASLAGRLLAKIFPAKKT